MKQITLIFTIFIICLANTNAPLQAQTSTTQHGDQIQSWPGQDLVLFTVSTTPTTKYFIDYGDGHYKIGQGNSDLLFNSYHQPATITTYFARDYDDDDDLDLASITVEPTVYSENDNNNDHFFSYDDAPLSTQAVWYAVPNRENMLIVTLNNKENELPATGTIEITLDPELSIVSNTDQYVYHYSNNNKSQLTNNNDHGSNKITFNYFGLSNNKIKNFFVPVHCATDATIDAMTGYRVALKTKSRPGTSPLFSQRHDVEVRAYPHDPNAKLVDKTQIFLDTYDAHSSRGNYLQYTITYVNEGDGIAKHVEIKDDISWPLDVRSARIVDYDNWNNTQPLLSGSGQTLTIMHNNINLPGKDKLVDNSNQHGYVVISIRIYPGYELSLGEEIQNQARIIFHDKYNDILSNNYRGTAPPIFTNIVSTEITDCETLQIVNCPFDDIICDIQDAPCSGNNKTNYAVINKQNGIITSPNPFDNYITIIDDTEEQENVQNIVLSLYNANGQLVKKTTHLTQVDTEKQVIHMTTQDLPKGLYTLRFQKGSAIKNKRIININE